MISDILEQRERDRKKFDPGTFFFHKESLGITALEHLKEQEYFGQESVKNLCHMFSNVPVHHFEDGNMKKCKSNKSFAYLKSYVCDSDLYTWCCHIAASYYSVKNPSWDYMIGFVSQRQGSDEKKIYTCLHSFNAKGEDFADPMFQSLCIQEQSWVEKGTFSPPPRLVPGDFHSYIGIKIPTNIVKDILFVEGWVQGNLWGYLLENILCSKEETEKFIDVLNGKREWQFQPKK